MATKETAVGIDHLTVVPENFEPAESLRPGPAFEEADRDESGE